MISIDRIINTIEEYHPVIIKTLKELIAIPTSNPPGINYQECVEYISNLLEQWGIEHRIVKGPDGNEERFAVIGSLGGKNDHSLHFHGHYDVVPVEAEAQFKPVEKDGRLYGRGSSDMKGGLVTMLFAIKVLKDLSPPLDGNVTFSIVPDEETGGRLGTGQLFKRGYLPLDGCIGMFMPEPTSGVVWNASKGALTLKISFKGRYAHIGLAHTGINAFEGLAKIAGALFELKRDIDTRVTSLPVHPPEAAKSVILIGGESGSGANFNIVPDKAWFTVDRRFNPEEDYENVKKEIIERIKTNCPDDVEFGIEELQGEVSSISNADNDIARCLSESVKAVTGSAPPFELCPGVLEVRFFNSRGIPAYAYGPGLLEVSHGPDEYIEISSMLDCTAVYVSTTIKLLTAT